MATAERLLAEAAREADAMMAQGRADVAALGAHLQQRRQQAEAEIQRMLDNAQRSGAPPSASRPPADAVDQAFERAGEPNGSATPTGVPGPTTSSG